MKKTLTTLVVLTALLFTSQKIQAASIPIFWSSGEVLSTVEKLPNEFVNDQNEHLNLAILHKRFSLFWIPIWNYGDFEYVLSTDDEKTYYSVVDSDYIEYLEAEYDMKISAMPSLSIWQKIGGKPLLALLIAFIIWSYIPKKKDDEEFATVSIPENEQAIENTSKEVENTQGTDTTEKEK